MEAHNDSPGADAAAAHRQELDKEQQTRDERDARVDPSALFRDLRRRNERLLRRAGLNKAQRERLLSWERVVQVQRERRFRRKG
jgi:hypothetical protein